MESMPVSIWLPGNKRQRHWGHTAAVMYSMAGWTHSPQGHQSPPGRCKRHCFLTVQWMNSLLPKKSQVSITEWWPASPISVFPTLIFRKEMLKWSYLSCQPLLDFSSFFLLCLIIPFCERWKQKKGKNKEAGWDVLFSKDTCSDLDISGGYRCNRKDTWQVTLFSISLHFANHCSGNYALIVP